MSTTITIDKTGRVVIPKEIREEFHLEPGDQLAVETDSERVTLRPIHRGSPLRKEGGVWVFAGGKRLSLEDANRLVGDARNRLSNSANDGPYRLLRLSHPNGEE